MNQVQRPSETMKPAAQKSCCCGPADNPHTTFSGAKGQTHDPVCGMVVDAATAKNRAEHKGQTYYFCCEGCKTKFMADPGQYLKPTARPAPSIPSAPNAPITQGTIYTCPMHPQIRRSAPGNCPICGMTLERSE